MLFENSIFQPNYFMENNEINLYYIILIRDKKNKYDKLAATDY